MVQYGLFGILDIFPQTQYNYKLKPKYRNNINSENKNCWPYDYNIICGPVVKYKWGNCMAVERNQGP